MTFDVIEIADMRENKIGTISRKTPRGVLLAWIGTADKRYGVGGWKTVKGQDESMFGGHITETQGDGRCLLVRPTEA